MSREYGKVFSSFWSSSDIRKLSEDGRTLALYLLTCSHGTIIGAFRIPDAYAAEDLQWGSERVSKGFMELFENGFATRDEPSKWVVVHRFLVWNEIENPNQAKAARKAYDQLPNDRVKFMVSLAFHAFASRWDIAPAEPLPNPSETVPEPLPNKQQQQQQDQQQQNHGEAPPAPKAKRAKRDPVKTNPPEMSDGPVFECWVELWKIPRADPELPKFLDHHRAKGSRFVDWSAAWRTWQRNAEAWGRKAPAQQRNIGHDPSIRRNELQAEIERKEALLTPEQRAEMESNPFASFADFGVQ